MHAEPRDTTTPQGAAPVPRQDRSGLVGNVWVLIGAVVYLLEFVAIIWADVAGLGSVAERRSSASAVVDSYAGHPDAAYAMAGWFAVVLLGRVLLFIGLRRALVDSGHAHPLLDLAVVASAVSVTLEVAAYAVATSVVALADEGEETLALAVDQVAAGLNLTIAGGLGVAIVGTTYVMWRSGLFSTPLNVIGALSGGGLVAAQLSIPPSLDAVFAVLAFFPLLFWVWMLWAGVVCWRARPRSG